MSNATLCELRYSASENFERFLAMAAFRQLIKLLKLFLWSLFKLMLEISSDSGDFGHVHT